MRTTGKADAGGLRRDAMRRQTLTAPRARPRALLELQSRPVGPRQFDSSTDHGGDGKLIHDRNADSAVSVPSQATFNTPDERYHGRGCGWPAPTDPAAQRLT